MGRYGRYISLPAPSEIEGFKEYVGLFWDSEECIFVDEDGEYVYDVYEWIKPSDFYMFFKKKEYMLVPSAWDLKVGVEMYWPDPEYINCIFATEFAKEVDQLRKDVRSPYLLEERYSL